MRELTWDYIAGFFDGEGCIKLYDRQDCDSRIGHLTIAQLSSNDLILYAIQDFLEDNNIKSKIRQTKSGNSITSYLYIVKQIEILKFLKEIGELVVVKENDVRLASEWLQNRLIKRSQAGWRSRSPFTNKEVKEMKRLAKKGVSQEKIAKQFKTTQRMVSLLIGKNYQFKTRTKSQLELAHELSKLAIPV